MLQLLLLRPQRIIITIELVEMGPSQSDPVTSTGSYTVSFTTVQTVNSVVARPSQSVVVPRPRTEPVLLFTETEIITVQAASLLDLTWHTWQALLAHARCARHRDPEWWTFNRQLSANNVKAIQICEGCPIQVECCEYARRHELLGIWGGRIWKWWDHWAARHPDHPLRKAEPAPVPAQRTAHRTGGEAA